MQSYTFFSYVNVRVRFIHIRLRFIQKESDGAPYETVLNVLQNIRIYVYKMLKRLVIMNG